MTQHSNKSILKGLIFLFVGIILLVHNLGLLSWLPEYFFSWKMILLIIGIYYLLKRSYIRAVIFMGLAIFLLFPEVLGFAFTYQLFWPGILILIGLLMLLEHSERFKKKNHINKSEPVNQTYMENTVIFSGESKQYSSYDFSGGKITTVFGGLEIDLVNCCLTKENNVIDVLAVCGGISITVPKEWNVKSEIVPIFAGVHDTITETPNAYVDPAAQLTLKGLVVMGGIEIKRA